MRRSSLLPAGFAAVLALGGTSSRTHARADEEPAARAALVSPEVTPDERDAVVDAVRGVVRLCLAAVDRPPSESAGDQLGLQCADDGLVLTTASYLATVSTDRERRPLWIRRDGRPWERAVAVARTPCGDLGLVRALRPERAGKAIELSDAVRVDRGFLVRAAPDGRALVDVVHRVATAWTDPALGGDTILTTRSALATSPSAKALSYRVTWTTPRGSDARGGPVVDAKGRLIGLVVATVGAGPVEVNTTPTEYLRLFLRAFEAEGSFRPADFGVRFSPSAEEATAGKVPAELLDVRAAGKLRGGALVADVAPRGPSAEILWPGDVVVELGGRPVSSTVPESFLPAWTSIRAGERTAIGVWRGGKKEIVYVTPRPGESGVR